MTVAQLVQPVHSVARHSRGAFLHALHHNTARVTRDTALWRAVGIGGAFAASGFAMMALALGG